jgi:large subunit ribosomal protein L15
MITLDKLKPHEGSKFNKKRLGRGNASGTGKTSGKGEKGQKARTGGNVNPAFEGGQMPLYRRLPKRGFKNPFKKEYGIVNLFQFSLFSDSNIDLNKAKEIGLVKKKMNLLKILGNGEIEGTFNVVCDFISEKAKEKIEAKGGVVTLIKKEEIKA